MTLKDIAKEAGVSISTVSRVLNQPDAHAAGPEVRDRIWAIVRRTGYVPNSAAQALKQKTTQKPTIASLHALIACPSGEVRDDPFFPALLSSIEQEAFQHNLILKYTYSLLDLDDPIMVEHMRENAQDSLIIVGRFDVKLFKSLKKKFKKIVYVGLNRLDAPCDQVICDGYYAMQDAVGYLHQQHHRSIGYIGAEPEGRYQGYLEGLRKCGLKEHSIQVDTLSMHGGALGMRRMLAQHPDVTAVLCGNDMTAIGALRACHEQGIQVPRDISLMGMNDIPNVRYVQPKLSSIHAPLEEMGALAVRILLDRMSSGRKLPITVSLPHHIVERDSCCAVSKRSGSPV